MKDGEYLTDRLGEEAAKFIEKTQDKPFFLYLPHFAVHSPTLGRADLVEKYTRKLKPGLRHNKATYAAMVESLDAAVGASPASSMSSSSPTAQSSRSHRTTAPSSRAAPRATRQSVSAKPRPTKAACACHSSSAGPV